jgi:hypothetical protein
LDRSHEEDSAKLVVYLLDMLSAIQPYLRCVLVAMLLQTSRGYDKEV